MGIALSMSSFDYSTATSLRVSDERILISENSQRHCGWAWTETHQTYCYYHRSHDRETPGRALRLVVVLLLVTALVKRLLPFAVPLLVTVVVRVVLAPVAFPLLSAVVFRNGGNWQRPRRFLY